MKNTGSTRLDKLVIGWLLFAVFGGTLLILALLTLGVIALGSWVLG